MVWSPAIQATDIRPLSPNLLQFFRDHQTEALNWANGGPGLDDFAVIYDTDEGSQYQIFPNVQVYGERYSTGLNDYGTGIKYTLDLVFEVHGADPNALKVEVRKRCYALESMALNIPSATLTNGLSGNTRPIINEASAELGPALKGEEGNWLIRSILKLTFEFTMIGVHP